MSIVTIVFPFQINNCLVTEPRDELITFGEITAFILKHDYKVKTQFIVIQNHCLQIPIQIYILIFYLTKPTSSL